MTVIVRLFVWSRRPGCMSSPGLRKGLIKASDHCLPCNTRAADMQAENGKTVGACRYT
ncbi:hypothetical protein [Nitrospirillum viridazoti]|uniref:hypothetical protein n=1 Tax=Nitrospirillum viridazoti TaxID=3144925 RepID=UPI0016435233|nr:hypothetical protein [Nitrospirillum amazonense]